MKSFEFEQLLSFKPRMRLTDCIRDLIFNNYLNLCAGDAEEANKLTKQFTDNLYKKFVK